MGNPPGSQSWEPPLGAQVGEPISEPQLGIPTGSHSWETKLGTHSWETQLGAKVGKPNWAAKPEFYPVFVPNGPAPPTAQSKPERLGTELGAQGCDQKAATPKVSIEIGSWKCLCCWFCLAFRLRPLMAQVLGAQGRAPKNSLPKLGFSGRAAVKTVIPLGSWLRFGPGPPKL